MATLVALEALRSGRRSAAAGAIVLLALVPILANRRVARTFDESAVFSPTPFARALARRDPSAAAPVLDQSRYRPDSALAAIPAGTDPGDLEFYRRSWFFYTPTFWRRSTVFNTDPDVGDLSRMQSLREMSSFVAATPAGGRLFSGLSLRFGIRFRDQEALPGYRRFGGAASQDWDENRDALAPVRLLGRWRETPDAVAALRTLPELSDGEVAIETGRAASGASPGGRLRFVENSPESLSLVVSAPAPTWLFVLRGFWPYRDVQVDGRAAEVFPATLAFSALPIAAGSHRIEWRETVPGLGISWLGPLAFVLVAAAIRRRAAPREVAVGAREEATAVSDARRPARRLGPALLFAGLVILVWSDPLFFRRNFTGRDLLPYNLPMEKTVHDAYARGRLPVWSPDDLGRPSAPSEPERRRALSRAAAARPPAVPGRDARSTRSCTGRRPEIGDARVPLDDRPLGGCGLDRRR